VDQLKQLVDMSPKFSGRREHYVFFHERWSDNVTRLVHIRQQPHPEEFLAELLILCLDNSMQVVMQLERKERHLSVRDMWLLLDREFGGDDTALRKAVHRLQLSSGASGRISTQNWREFSVQFLSRVRQARLGTEEAYYTLMDRIPPGLRKDIYTRQEIQGKREPHFLLRGLSGVEFPEVASIFHSISPLISVSPCPDGFFITTPSTSVGDTVASLDGQFIPFGPTSNYQCLKIERRPVHRSLEKIIEEIKFHLEIQERTENDIGSTSNFLPRDRDRQQNFRPPQKPAHIRSLPVSPPRL
jgi:hypothetical protein